MKYLTHSKTINKANTELSYDPDHGRIKLSSMRIDIGYPTSSGAASGGSITSRSCFQASASTTSKEANSIRFLGLVDAFYGSRQWEPVAPARMPFAVRPTKPSA